MISTNQVNSNVKWLSNEEKGLIDLSDFSSELKVGNNNIPNKKKEDRAQYTAHNF